jgi:hypothetical protein
MDGLLVPSSIQRVRAFLVEMCGMKVKPWASTEETLGALHTMLVARQGCDIFWTSLRTLLERLACDLKTRQDALPGTLVDNEVLDNQRYAALLDEIRACLDRQVGEATMGSFRRLASGLSAPALGLLLLLGGAATVGCDRAPLKGSSKTPDAAAQVTDAKSADPDANAEVPKIDLPSSPDGPRDPYVAPDVAPAWDAVAVGPDGAVVTIQDIMNSCNISNSQQTEVLRCLSALRASWTTGLTQELAGQTCAAVTSRLAAFACSMEPCLPRSEKSDDFTAGDVPFCPIPIYMGVRFV